MNIVRKGYPSGILNIDDPESQKTNLYNKEAKEY